MNSEMNSEMALRYSCTIPCVANHDILAMAGVETRNWTENRRNNTLN